MYCQRYPRTVKIYLEDERVLIIPWIDHFAGYRVINGKYYVCKYNDLSGIGEKVFEALKFIDESPECTINLNELEALKPNHYGSKYKTWKSFYKNNDCINVVLQENGELHILAEDFGEIILSPDFSAEEIGRAVASIIAKAEESRKFVPKSNKGKSSEIKKTSTDEKIILADTSHLAEDEFYGSGDSTYKVSFRINDSFCEFKSHAMEVAMLHVYAPGYNPEFDDDDIREDTVPSVSLLDDETIFEAVEDYKTKGTFDGAKELVPLSGMFRFKAKMPYYEHMMYFYAIDMCGGYLNNMGLCMIYPKSYENTDDEKKLISVLDKIAESYTEERIG